MADSKVSALTDGTSPQSTDQFVVARSTANNKLSWSEMQAAMPGYEIGYDQLTSTVNVTSTTEASGTTVITCAAHTFDGGAVIVEFFSPQVFAGSNTNNTIFISLFESTTQISRLCELFTPGGTNISHAVSLAGRYKFTPSSGSHSYLITAHCSVGTTSTPKVVGGAGGTGADPPAYVRFTKV